MFKMYDIIIIGGGVAGLSAAMYAGRLNLKVLVVGDNLGGTIALTHVVENYPSIKSISGPELAQKFEEHAKEYDIDIKQDKVVDIKHNADCFGVKIGEEVVKTKTVILASGTQWRKLDAPGSKEFESKGLHYCALCDGPLYKGKTVAVVGGSDSAAKDALFMTEHAEKVYILARSTLKAEPINIKRIEKSDKIQVVEAVNVREIKGDKFVEKLILDKDVNGSKELDVGAVFIAIGHISNSSLAGQIKAELNAKKEVKVDRESKTNIKGFFAAGDVTDAPFKQAIIGAGQAVVAVYSAYKYIKEAEINCS